jgi:hypothetical protein
MRDLFLSIVLGVGAALAHADAARAQTLDDLYPSLGAVVASDGGGGDRFGHAVALSGNTLAVGAPYDHVGANADQGSVRVFVRNGASWTLQATLTASIDGAAFDKFGSSVALDGDTLVVGVPEDDYGANGGQGTVRVFVRIGTIWALQQLLVAGDGAAGDLFGSSVSLDGDTLAVGVPGDDVTAVEDAGSVRVYVRTGSSWSFHSLLSASDAAAYDDFGTEVSLSGDVLAVGVPDDDVGANANQGSVRMFARSGSAWSAQQTLTAIDGGAFERFGSSVSLDGDALVVGVPSGGVGSIAGSARVFGRSGSIWTEQQTLVRNGGATGTEYGKSVALAGNTLAVAGSDDDVVQLFIKVGSTWALRRTIRPDLGMEGDQFGESLALSGVVLAAGAPYADLGASVDQGTVRVYGNYRVLNETTSVGYTSLASAIAASSDDDRLVVGAPAFAEADGIVDASQKRLEFVSVEPLVLAEPALMLIGTDSSFERSLDVASAGLTVKGDLIAPTGGNLLFEQLTIGNGGQFLQRGSALLVNQSLTTASGGVCYMEGSVFAESVTTAVGGQNRCSGDTDVHADYDNAGSTFVQRGILYIFGDLVNTGTMTGEVETSLLPPSPGDGYAIGGDYAVDAASSIVLPDPVWWLRVGGSFDMAIDSASRFVMDRATLEMSGVGDSKVQSLEVFARDFGAIDDGFATTNYLVGALRIRAGANVSLEDNHNNASGKTAEAIYTNELFVPAGATLATNGHRIYVRSATIAGTVSDPAEIVVVPDVPPCPADLFTDGIVNAADLGAVLTAWGPCGGPCTADIDGDGQVGASDLSLLLASWGPCAPN